VQDLLHDGLVGFTMKVLLVVSWIRVLCVVVCLWSTMASEDVHVGAIFSLDTINGRVSKFAMEAAVADINSDPSILGGRTLSLQIHDSNYSGFLSIMGGKFPCKFFPARVIFLRNCIHALYFVCFI